MKFFIFLFLLLCNVLINAQTYSYDNDADNIRKKLKQPYYIKSADGHYIVDTSPLNPTSFDVYTDIKKSPITVPINMSGKTVKNFQVNGNHLFITYTKGKIFNLLIVDMSTWEEIKNIEIEIEKKSTYVAKTFVSGNGKYILVHTSDDVFTNYFNVIDFNKGQISSLAFHDLKFNRHPNRSFPYPTPYKNYVDNEGNLYILSVYGELLIIDIDGNETFRVSIGDLPAGDFVDIGWDAYKQKVVGIRITKGQEFGFYMYDDVKNITNTTDHFFPITKFKARPDRTSLSLNTVFENGPNGMLAIRMRDNATEQNGFHTSEYLSNVYLLDKDRHLVKKITIGSDVGIGFVNNKLIGYSYAPKGYCDNPEVSLEIKGLGTLKWFLTVFVIDESGQVKCIETDSQMGMAGIPFMWSNIIFTSSGKFYSYR